MSPFPGGQRLGIAATAVLAATLMASAQDAAIQTETQRETTTTTETTTHTNNQLTTILKSKVVIQEDQPAGQVVDFVLSDGGCVEYVVASYDDQYYAIPYSAATVRFDDRLVFVDM